MEGGAASGNLHYLIRKRAAVPSSRSLPFVVIQGAAVEDPPSNVNELPLKWSTQRFYSMSSQIRAERKTYCATLEATQKGTLDVTPWVRWFLDCLVAGVRARGGLAGPADFERAERMCLEGDRRYARACVTMADLTILNQFGSYERSMRPIGWLSKPRLARTATGTPARGSQRTSGPSRRKCERQSLARAAPHSISPAMATANMVPASEAVTAMRAFWNPMVSGTSVTSSPTEPGSVCWGSGMQ